MNNKTKEVWIPKYKMINRKPENGDCLRGALANIVNIPAKNLPNYSDYFNWEEKVVGKNWRKKAEYHLNKVYRPYGFRVKYASDSVGLQVGISCNYKKGESHALVCYDGKVIWCPGSGKVRWSRRHIKYYLNVYKIKPKSS